MKSARSFKLIIETESPDGLELLPFLKYAAYCMPHPNSDSFVRTLFLTTFLEAITRRYSKNWLFTIDLYYWSYCQQFNTYCKDGTPESRVETDVRVELFRNL